MLSTLAPRVRRQSDAEGHVGTSAERLYDGMWRKARDQHLDAHPLCRFCEAGAWGDPPRTTAATVVDHLYPHQGQRWLFWLRRLWVSACAPCHNGPKQQAERRGPAALDDLARRLGLPTLIEARRDGG